MIVVFEMPDIGKVTAEIEVHKEFCEVDILTIDGKEVVSMDQELEDTLKTKALVEMCI